MCVRGAFPRRDEGGAESPEEDKWKTGIYLFSVGASFPGIIDLGRLFEDISSGLVFSGMLVSVRKILGFLASRVRRIL